MKIYVPMRIEPYEGIWPIEDPIKAYRTLEDAQAVFKKKRVAKASQEVYEVEVEE